MICTCFFLLERESVQDVRGIKLQLLRDEERWGETRIVIKKLNKRGGFWLLISLGSASSSPQVEAAASPGVYHASGTSEISSPSFLHVLNQAGGLVESMLLCNEECKSIWPKERELGVENGVLER